MVDFNNSNPTIIGTDKMFRTFFIKIHKGTVWFQEIFDHVYMEKRNT